MNPHVSIRASFNNKSGESGTHALHSTVNTAPCLHIYITIIITRRGGERERGPGGGGRGDGRGWESSIWGKGGSVGTPSHASLPQTSPSLPVPCLLYSQTRQNQLPCHFIFFDTSISLNSTCFLSSTQHPIENSIPTNPKPKYP